MNIQNFFENSTLNDLAINDRLDGWAVATQGGDFVVRALDDAAAAASRDEAANVAAATDEQATRFACHGFAALRMLVEVVGSVPQTLRSADDVRVVPEAAQACLQGLEHFVEQFRQGMSTLYQDSSCGVPSSGFAEQMAGLWLPLNALNIAVMDVRGSMDAGAEHQMAASASLKALCKPLSDFGSACANMADEQGFGNMGELLAELGELLVGTLDQVEQLADQVSDLAGLEVGRHLVEMLANQSNGARFI